MILALALLFTSLPDMPLPKPSEPLETRYTVMPSQSPKFWDKPAKTALIANIGLLGFDMGQTCHNLSSGGHEDFLPVHNCAGAVGILSAEAIAAWSGAYLAHKHGLHKLERAFEWVMPVVNTRAIIYSKQHGAW